VTFVVPCVLCDPFLQVTNLPAGRQGARRRHKEHKVQGFTKSTDRIID